MIHFLEGLKLAELFSRNCNVVPDDVHISMSVSFVTALLLSLRDLVLFPFFLSTVFFALIGRWATIAIVLLLCSDHFPFHLKGTFAKKLILGLCQINSYLSSVEDIEVALANDHLLWLLLYLLLCNHGVTGLLLNG